MAFLENFMTETEFLAEAKGRGMKVGRRALRAWRQKRLIPYTKVGRTILIRRDWHNELKVTRTRNASA
jgi:hypothetical protein